jgi:outer membrane protein assembly factor BamE
MTSWRIAVLALTALTSACVRIYTPEVRQGNLVTQEMVDQLKTGMSHRQVQFALGTPLIMDPFHQDRWDYYYSLKEGHKPEERRILTLYFENDALVKITGDVQPSPKDSVPAEPRPTPHKSKSL